MKAKKGCGQHRNVHLSKLRHEGGRYSDGTDGRGYDSSARICASLLFYSHYCWLKSKGQIPSAVPCKQSDFVKKNNQDRRLSYVLSTINSIFYVQNFFYCIPTVHRESPLHFLHHFSAPRSSTLPVRSSTSDNLTAWQAATSHIWPLASKSIQKPEM